MDLREERQFKIFTLLRRRLLRATTVQTLVTLLVSLDRASGGARPTVPVKLDSDDLLLWLAADFIGSTTCLSGHIAPGAARHGADADASVLSDRRVDPVDDFILAALLGRNVLHVVGLVRGRVVVRVLLVADLFHVDDALRRFQASMDLDLRGVRRVLARGARPAVIGSGAALEDGVAGTFLWALLLLGTQWLVANLDSSMRATSVACRHNGDLLDAVLATTGACRYLSSGRAVSRLGDCRGTQANLRGTTDNCTGRYESFWCGLVSRWIDILLFDDRGLITGAHVGLLAAYAATGVRAHVLDLSNVMLTISSFDIVQDDTTVI